MSASQSNHYVTFGVADELLAAPVEAVREVLAVPPMTHVPNAPEFLVGIIDVRGHSVPVIDMRRKLGLPPIEPTESSRVLVLEVLLGGRSATIGALADRVLEVITLDNQLLQPPPEIGVRWSSNAIAGIGRRDDHFVILLDLPAVFASDKALLAGTAG
jgi:purine-binding chemotaxis protein CheW